MRGVIVPFRRAADHAQPEAPPQRAKGWLLVIAWALAVIVPWGLILGSIYWLFFR